MREIKFRARTIPYKEDDFEYTGEWVYGFYHEDGNGQAYIIKNKSQGRAYPGAKVIRETVGQFIGLHDKNGVEVYDGDSLQWNNAKGVDGEYGVVVWDNNRSAWMVYIDEYESVYLYDVHYADIEVIGNTHDNGGKS